jgi:hypothetical protein
MKKLTSISCGLLLLASTSSSFALIGLQVSVVGTNAALTWPSANVGETYLIQYRSNLTSSAWVTVADFVSPSSSNTTTFVDASNIVRFPVISAGMTNSGGAGNPNPPGPGDIGTNSPGTNSLGTNVLNATIGFYQVVRDGTFMYGVTNGTVWTDIVQVPVELGNSFGTIGTMSLTEGGDPIGDSIQPASTTLTVDSTQITNGVHQVSLSTSWTDTNGNYVEADSPPVSVTVRNEISYPDWIPAYGELGNSVLFQAVSLHTNCSWQIDVYGSDYLYIGSLNGSCTDGNIICEWNLVDGNGVTHTNDTFFICVITTFYDSSSGTSQVHPLISSSSSSITPPTYKVNDPWLGPGKFAIAIQHAWDTTTDSDLLYGELDGFTGAANSSFGVLPSQSSTPYAIPFNSVDNGNNGDSATGWATFKTALYDPYVRNLVYFGHGGEVGLGYNTSNTNVSALASEIGATLHNIPAGQTNAHRFRFVFVDGCSTASGKMPEAFGIIHRENVPSINYLNASLRPSCYCGWNDDKSIDYISGSAINYGHVSFISDIQTDMLLNSATISLAIIYAENDPAVTDTFNTTYDFKVFGCWDVTFGSNND